MDESIEFASLAATEELLFTLNDSNIANYKYAARVIISSTQIELSLKQFLSAFINACIDLIKDIKSPRIIETLESMKTVENNKRNLGIQKVISLINESSNHIEQNETLKIVFINDDLLSLQNILEEKINISNVHLNLSQNEKQLLVENSHEPTLLEYAAFYGSERCFNYPCSLEKSQMRSTIGRFAICGGNLNIIKTVIDSGICLKNDVKFAIKFHHFDAFKQLFSLYFEFDNSAYNEAQNNFCLLCIKFFSIRILRFLIEFDADINDCLVNEALSNNVHSLFMFLMQFNVNLNQRNKKGQKALDCANVSKNKYSSQIILNKLNMHLI